VAASGDETRAEAPCERCIDPSTDEPAVSGSTDLSAPCTSQLRRTQRQSVARLVGRGQHTSPRTQRTVEEHGLDSVMIVEVLDMAEIRYGSSNVGVEVQGTVRRHLQST
jgi:hypothetical protein